MSDFRFTSHRQEVEAQLGRAFREALDKMGDFAVMKAQDYATVDTGNMRASITHEEADPNTERYGTSNAQAPIKPIEYAPYVELGTRRMSAQPFIRPAAENHVSELAQIARQELTAQMNQN